MPDSTASNTASGGYASLLVTWKEDILASVVVFLVALPLSMGIAIASGVPMEKAASVGLITAIIGGIVVGPLSGERVARRPRRGASGSGIAGTTVVEIVGVGSRTRLPRLRATLLGLIVLPGPPGQLGTTTPGGGGRTGHRLGNPARHLPAARLGRNSQID
ncbi:MAG TPA: SulP family inorganic anion transporter [Methylococcaceae bacterium]|nr:SulP family inorganic anion transporter [Methylococcaceae bacterium]